MKAFSSPNSFLFFSSANLAREARVRAQTRIMQASTDQVEELKGFKKLDQVRAACETE